MGDYLLSSIFSRVKIVTCIQRIVQKQLTMFAMVPSLYNKKTVSNIFNNHFPNRSNTDFGPDFRSCWGLFMVTFSLPEVSCFGVDFKGFDFPVGSMSIANGFLGRGFTDLIGLKTLSLLWRPSLMELCSPRVTIRVDFEAMPGFDEVDDIFPNLPDIPLLFDWVALETLSPNLLNTLLPLFVS